MANTESHAKAITLGRMDIATSDGIAPGRLPPRALARVAISRIICSESRQGVGLSTSRSVPDSFGFRLSKIGSCDISFRTTKEDDR